MASATKPYGQYVQGSNSSDMPMSATETPFDPMDLWDLVQVTCLSGARRVIQVGCGASSGHLYLQGGQVVHATIGHLVGDEAALAILQRRDAPIESCTRPFPVDATVTTAWQGLLLRAAQVLDERAHRRPQNHPGPDQGNSSVRRLRTEGTPPRSESLENVEEIEFLEGSEELLLELDEFDEPLRSEPSDDTLQESEYRQLAWIDRTGQVIQELGDQPEFAGTAAYAAQVAQLVGSLLSLGGFVGLECQQGAATRFAYADGAGGIVACVPCSDETAAMLRRRLAL